MPRLASSPSAVPSSPCTRSSGLAWAMAQASPELRVQGLLGTAEGLLASRGIAPPCLFLYTCAAWLQEPD